MTTDGSVGELETDLRPETVTEGEKEEENEEEMHAEEKEGRVLHDAPVSDGSSNHHIDETQSPVQVNVSSYQTPLDALASSRHCESASTEHDVLESYGHGRYLINPQAWNNVSLTSSAVEAPESATRSDTLLVEDEPADAAASCCWAASSLEQQRLQMPERPLR